MSDQLKLTAETGRVLGSSASRRLRRQDKIPAVIYGHGSDPVAIALDRPLFRAALNASGPNAVITLDVDGTEHLTIVKDMQRDPIANRVTHVDFLITSLDEKQVVDVPVVLVGEAVIAGREGAVIQQQQMTLTVEAAVADIPASIEVDISEVSMASPLQLADIELPSGVVAQAEPDTILVVAQRTRASIAAEEAEDGSQVGGDDVDADDAGDAEDQAVEE